MERLLFVFRDGDRQLIPLDNEFFPLAVLLQRLLHEKYTEKKVKWLNIKFMTEETYRLHPTSVKHYTHNYGGILWHNDVFDLRSFEKMSYEEQKLFIWKRAYEVITEASKNTKNVKLKEAIKYAYTEGLARNLNPDYKIITADGNLYGQQVTASIWINFYREGMSSKLTIEKDNRILFEKQIDHTKPGIEFFLDMYKKIEVDNNAIVIKGRKDVEYLPLKIPIDVEVLKP